MAELNAAICLVTDANKQIMLIGPTIAFTVRRYAAAPFHSRSFSSSLGTYHLYDYVSYLYLDIKISSINI